MSRSTPNVFPEASVVPIKGDTSPVLGKRELNRALLARQLLLRRSSLSALEAIGHLAGMQAQVPNPPYFGLWTRLKDFRQEDLSQLYMEHKVVRIALMRSTIHLVTSDDCLFLRPLIQPVLERGFKGPYGRKLAGADIDAVADAGRALVEERPRTFHELGKLLHEAWPESGADALSAAVRTYVPLVQVPPRGLWGESGAAAHTSAEAWLGRPLTSDASAEELVCRYLAAFGPATVKDIQVWSGLTKLRETVDRLRPRLLTFRDERGNELFDLPDAPRPDPNTPAPPRFLGEFDNMLLSYDDRSRIIADEYRPLVFTENGIIRAAILVDGFVRGIWKIERSKSEAVLVIESFAPLTALQTAELAEEGAKLLDFAAPDAGSRDVRFVSRT
ncbi:winged helix DNA-binding domain-containing protein [Paenibacillus contaminans]|uniref:Winged helix DNA-binding domain-containing protein n=2 Tax=Paenibacillus contaminans TaxID=450362 RepID=A0A329M906_9BACL|nr:winged helix DNA-binding domain-containing protein [Paenibacillus contaminans]